MFRGKPDLAACANSPLFYTAKKKKKKVNVFMRLTEYGGWKGWSDRPERTPMSPALGGIQKTVRWRRGLLHRLKAPPGGPA